MSTVTFYNGDAVTCGDQLEWNLTFTTDGAPTDLTSDTLQCSLMHKGRKVITNHSVDPVTPADGIFRITILPAESALLPGGGFGQPYAEIFGDVYATLAKRHFGPFRFLTRKAIT